MARYRPMTTREAVSVLNGKGWTDYAIAKQLDAFPISVYQWKRGTKMSERFRVKFSEHFGITIDDT